MRKHDARKWLHAALDLLPVILIPVFMIYSHRHTMTERTQVDISYKYQSNEVNSVNDLVEGNIYYFNDDVNLLDFQSNDTYTIYILKSYLYFELDENNLLFNTDYEFYEYEQPVIYQHIHDLYTIRIFGSDYLATEMWLTNAIFYYEGNFNNVIANEQLIDSIEYTDYNEIESVEVNDETSSIMNVFMDDFNNSIDKYFNMGNVFNLNGVYQWFNTNIFGGSAPVVIYSVWNIVLYEFVMDLLFLLYGLFMWFIDMCQHLMEKPFRSIR